MENETSPILCGIPGRNQDRENHWNEILAQHFAVHQDENRTAKISKKISQQTFTVH